MALLSQVEESTLADLDRLVDWYSSHKQDCKAITVTQRQYNALMRISKKNVDGKLFRRVGDLDLKDNIYRGFEIRTIEQARRKRKADTMDFLTA